jgi:protein SCO1/2
MRLGCRGRLGALARILALILVAFALAPGQPHAQPAVPGETILPAGVPLGGGFTLRDQHGQRRTEQDLRGGWVLLYFGYTSCPDICPTELQAIAAALDALSPAAAARVRPVFITIDPERDTPERLAAYVALFHPRLLGLTGSAAEIAAVAHGYRVSYARAAAPGAADYLMDHSSILYLLDPAGAVRALFRPNTSPEDLAAALRRWLG